MKKSLLLTLYVSGHLAYMVLLPLAIFGGIGLYLDRQLLTSPLFVLVGIGFAFLATIWWMYTRLQSIIQEGLKK